MIKAPPPKSDESSARSACLKAVRRLRGLTRADLARAMHVSPRTYDRFESGELRLNIDYIHRFAAATDTDPHAILLAILRNRPQLAVNWSEIRLASFLVCGASDLNDNVGEAVRSLQPHVIVEEVTHMFDRLAAKALAAHEARLRFELEMKKAVSPYRANAKSDEDIF